MNEQVESRSESDYELDLSTSKFDEESAIDIESINETDSDLDIEINEELINKSQEEIEKRMSSLKTLISGLREQLRNEKELWKQEVEQVIATQNHYMAHVLYYPSHFYCSGWNNEHCNCEYFINQRRICNVSRSDEDLHLVRYRDLPNHPFGLNDFHQNCAIESYKKKLLEVESMCTLELNRVKNSVQSLQTLQQLASEWDHASGDNGSKISQKMFNSSAQPHQDNNENNTMKNNGDSTPVIDSPRAVETN